MLSDFAFENCIDTIIRGARSSPDFDTEKLLSDINRYNGVDTIIYTTTPELAHVSSSAAKAIILNAGKNIVDFVSVDVKRKLEEKLLYQYRIGITGGIGVGKSYIAQQLSKFCQSALDVHTIDFDSIGHYILEKAREPIHREVRELICSLLKIEQDTPGDFIDIEELRDKIFSNENRYNDITEYNRSMFDTAMFEPSMHEVRKLLLEYKGSEHRKSLVLITGALLGDLEDYSLFNNNLILVSAPEDTVLKRLKERGYSDQVIKDRLEAQLCFENVERSAKKFIDTDKSGHLWKIDNSDGASSYKFMDIMNALRIA